MRLLNATTFEIGSFADDQIPPYAILSHTWASQTSEVSFHDVHGATAPIGDGGSFKEKTGWAKIEGACAQSLARGCEHIWIDTCCVDKSSSAELQESINSMFRWYAGAEICLAFLSDVPGTAAEDVDVGAEDSFRRARWFTRGWTLQELLAPTTVEFFNRDWKSLGTKDSLSEVIQDITGIPPQYLCWDSLGIWGMGSGHERLSRASVADRMSWAAGRQTTRSEDMAYCLLGLFGVYMPMLYGEGDRAFARLQEEIMKETDDCTLLSWGYAQLWNDRADTRTILAPNPAAFEHCGGLVPRRLEGFSRPWFSLGQQGLALSLPVKDDRKYGCVVYAILACGPSVSTGSLVAVPLISVSACDSATLWKGPNEYLRYSWCTPTLVPPEFLSGAETRKIVIRRPSPVYEALRNFPIRLKAPRDYELVATYPPQPTYPVIGTCFVDVGSSHPTHRAAEGDAGGSRQQQQILQVRTGSLGDLLVLIAFRITPALADTDGSTPQRQGACASCRVFKLPSSHFDLQLLHGWAGSEDGAAQPEEVPGAARSDRSTIFRVNGRSRSVLAVQITELPGDGAGGTTTSISIFEDWDWGGCVKGSASRV